jgi:uncharacterized protein
MTFDFASISAAFFLGLLSSAHCVGMCGGIMGALSMAIPAEAKSKRWMILLGYNFARIFSYALIGIAMGLYLADWWRGLTYLESAGRYLWAYLQPLSKKLMPVNSVAKALALGMIWGWLPCGLVYSALMFAMAQGQAMNSGMVMLSFGVGTLPMVLLSGVFAQTLTGWLQRKQLRWSFALMIMLFGLWTLFGTSMHSHSGDEHNTHDHHHHQMHQDSNSHDKHH